MNKSIAEVQDKEALQTSETNIETQDKVNIRNTKMKLRTIIRRITRVQEMILKPSLFLLKKKRQRIELGAHYSIHKKPKMGKPKVKIRTKANECVQRDRIAIDTHTCTSEKKTHRRPP